MAKQYRIIKYDLCLHLDLIFPLKPSQGSGKEGFKGKIISLLIECQLWFRRSLKYVKVSGSFDKLKNKSIFSVHLRRVVNLRLKGASIYWLQDTAEAMLLLRSFYKSGRWDMLKIQTFSIGYCPVS